MPKCSCKGINCCKFQQSLRQKNKTRLTCNRNGSNTTSDTEIDNLYYCKSTQSHLHDSQNNLNISCKNCIVFHVLVLFIVTYLQSQNYHERSNMKYLKRPDRISPSSRSIPNSNTGLSNDFAYHELYSRVNRFFACRSYASLSNFDLKQSIYQLSFPMVTYC